MKRLLTSLLLFATVVHAQATTIFSTPTAIDWSASGWAQIAASEFASAAVGDRLVLSITYTGGTDWPQVAILNGSTWGELSGAGNTSIDSQTTEVTYYLTSSMLADMQASGIIVSGIGYTLNAVDLEAEYATGLDDALWIGSTTLLSDWSVYVQVPASSFAGAQVGQLLRFHHDNIVAGAQLSPRGSDWNMLPDTEATTPQGGYTAFEVTSDMLSSLQSGGLIVSGCGFRLTWLDCIDADALPELTLSVPVTDGWVFEGDDKPHISVVARNDGDATITAHAVLTVNTDKFESYAQLEQTADIAAGQTDTLAFEFEADPGFYVCTALVNDELARGFNIGVNPEQIVSSPDMQSDFESFWQQAKEELSQVSIDATLTLLSDKSSAKRNVYLVEMKSIADTSGGEPATIRAYYAEPVDDGQYPVIVHYQGYDDGSSDPWCPSGNDLPGYCELVLSTRGQVINNRDPYTNTYDDWFQYNFGDKDTYYYRGAYMDVVRAIDFVCTRDKADQSNLFAEGSSQGGAFTYAAAALTDHTLQAIAPSVPFMGDFPDYFQMASWPAYQAQQQQEALGLSDEEMYAFLSYFDTKNLATLVTAPVISTIGLQDNVCPPHTNIAPYNNLPDTVEKEISYNAELSHATPSDWYTTYMAFFSAHMNTDGITAVDLGITNMPDRRYNLAGQRVDTDYRGIVIENGRKFIAK